MTKNTDIANILDQATTFNVSAAVGANVIANTTTLRVGNTTVNVVANSTSIKLANSTVNTQIVVPTSAQYTGSYFLHANGSWQPAGGLPGGADTQVQYNDAGALGGTAGFTFNETTNNVSIANTLLVGANVQVNTSTVFIGNSTVNGAANSIFIGVSNSSGAATLQPTGLTVDCTSTANVFANATILSLSNSTSTANITPSTLRIGTSTANIIANSTIVKLSNSTVNTAITIPSAAQYAGSYYLHANGTWQLVSAGATPGGANTQVQFNDSTALGGTAGFTFDKATNNAIIANSLTVGTTFTTNSIVTNAVAVTTAGIRANATGVYPTSNTVGQALGLTAQRWVLFANSIDVSGTWTANGALGGASQILTANSIGGAYWAAPAGGGNVTKVGTPVDNQVGVWTGDGTIEGTAAFTFNATGNNATIANTLTVGTATVNSTLANVSALNVINQTNTATLFVTTSANVGTAVLANSIGLTTTGFVNAATVVNSAAHTIASTFIANTLGVTHTGFVNAATVVNSASHTIGTTLVANTLGVFHTAIMNAASHTTSGITANATGVYPSSNTVGTALGITTARWILLANTVESTGLANLSALNVVNQTNTATLVATTSAAVGANVIANTTSVAIGNSSVNGTANSVFLQVANSSGSASIDPLGLIVGNSSVNSTTISANNYAGIPVSKAANGYAYLFNGVIIQWGKLIVNSSSTATFPLAFPTACQSVSALPANTEYIGANTIYVAVVNTTIAQFRSATTNTTTLAYYTAIGY